MFKSVASSVIARGVLALVVGAVALAWPGVTVGAFVVMFAVYAFLDAFAQLGLAFASPTAKPLFGHLVLGVVEIAAGVIALAWPGATALALVLLVGGWAIVTGVIEFAAAFRSGATAGYRAMSVVGGLVSIVFGVVLFARPEVGAVTLAVMFGLFNVVVGTGMLVQGIQLRSADKQLRSLTQPATVPVAA
ncbi:HdeD family acid-resistance protein [Cellulomonas sp. ICMP 17802]|uniref:HdeD family acid-resistance protein n=1 Tax=Cellulomonas sp. ICMP 17802 TaxID=3239199 RepID=UPI00351B4FF0